MLPVNEKIRMRWHHWFSVKTFLSFQLRRNYVQCVVSIIMVMISWGSSVQFSPALRAARTEQPAVAEMPTHSFVQPATRLKP